MTGRVVRHFTTDFRPEVERMRRAAGQCGLDRRLFQPTLSRSLWLILTGRDPSLEFGAAYERKKEGPC